VRSLASDPAGSEWLAALGAIEGNQSGELDFPDPLFLRMSAVPNLSDELVPVLAYNTYIGFAVELTTG
jgi:hypothetical protein